MTKTLYIWDLAGTLFPEKWDEKKSSVASYDNYLRAQGKDPQAISRLEYEQGYEIPYRTGLMDITLGDGFRKVLSWTKNNAVFTTGNREQVDWRAEQLERKYGFDIRDYLKEIHSTFDYGNTNRKTKEMLQDILHKKFVEGFDAVVYTDDNLQNCQFFVKAFQELPSAPLFNPFDSAQGSQRGEGGVPKVGAGPSHRVYHILNDNRGLRPRGDYWEIGNLYDMMDNEKTYVN